MFNVKVIKEFKVGSSYFFDKFDDFKSKDEDFLLITDNPINSKHKLMGFKIENKDYFIISNLSKEALLDYHINCKTPMLCGKFLIPEVCEFFNITIDDLKQLDSKFKNMDQNHKYETFIYNCYLENNKINLTKEQLLEAYKLYKNK